MISALKREIAKLAVANDGLASNTAASAVLLPKADDSSMALASRPAILGWAGPWAIQSQTLFTKIESAKQYARHCKPQSFV